MSINDARLQPIKSELPLAVTCSAVHQASSSMLTEPVYSLLTAV